MVMSPYQRGTLFVNPTLANPKEFKSYKDLLDTKWKGKIVADDPRKSGPGQATFTFFFLHPELGVKFIRRLPVRDLPCSEITLRRSTCSARGVIRRHRALRCLG